MPMLKGIVSVSVVPVGYILQLSVARDTDNISRS